ncbi:MAG: response regulator [Myxococcota bacterium]|jgi:DNA-binding NarL/FixJ family response regulator|nr:response regulator [Myxococcota bacterium]
MTSSHDSVLIVDDDPGVLAALEAELQDHFDVALVGSAEQALVSLQNRAFAAIISDVRMPGVDGLSLIRQCAVRYPNMVRIILTAFDNDEVQETALSAHGAFKLVKPWGDDLLITLSNALKQRESTVSLRKHLDLTSELLDIDRKLHTELPELKLLLRAAEEIARVEEVTAAALYLFTSDGEPKAHIIKVDDSGIPPTLCKTRSGPITFEAGHLYCVPIGGWKKPAAVIALRLSSVAPEIVRYADFVARIAYRTRLLTQAGLHDNNVDSAAPVGPAPTIDVAIEGKHLRSILHELTTPATVLEGAAQSLRQIAWELDEAHESPRERMIALRGEIEDMATDLSTISESVNSLLERLRHMGGS